MSETFHHQPKLEIRRFLPKKNLENFQGVTTINPNVPQCCTKVGPIVPHQAFSLFLNHQHPSKHFRVIWAQINHVKNCGGGVERRDGWQSKLFTELGPRPSQELSGCAWMIEIGQTFASYLAQNNQRIGRSGTYKHARLQALSLTTASWLCHRMITRVTSDISKITIHFSSVAQRFRARDRNMLQRPPDNRSKVPIIQLYIF